tara:strand:+ start:1826 stop:2530 length:705 start_codon:yes stop_codon:yes gene_type:complete
MGTPLISDFQFDQLEADLYKVNPNSYYFTKKTILPLPSLPKDHIGEFLNGLTLQTRLIIEPKINGCAIAIQYIDGKLIKAINRNGLDFTNKIRKVPDVPNEIEIKGLFQVRGELFAPSEYERPSFSHRKASVFLKSFDSESTHLSFCSFQIINGKLNQHESLVCLKKLGFTIPEYKSLKFTSQLEMFRKQWNDKKLFFDYPTNGIVVKINSRKLQLLREKSNKAYPIWQMAIKY